MAAAFLSLAENCLRRFAPIATASLLLPIFVLEFPFTNFLATLSLVLSGLVCPIPTVRATPVVTSPSTASGQVGQPFNYEITTAAQNDKNNVTAAGLPPGLGVVVSVSTINGRTTMFAAVQGTPTAEGTYPSTLSLRDNTGTANFTLTITVAPPAPMAPVITSAPAVSVQVGQPFAYQITTALNNATGFAASGLPDGLSLEPNTGLISGTPAAEGAFPVALSATNGSGTGTMTLTLSIAPAPATATTISVSVDQPTISRGAGQAATITFTRSVGDLSQPLKVAYAVTSTLIGGNDYVTLSGTKKLKPGKASGSIQVVPLPGGANGKLNLKVVPGSGYTVGSPAKVKVKITD